MAKTINNTTARDIGAVFDVAYLSDLSAVENTLSTRMDSLESSIQTDEETITSLLASIEDDEQRIGTLEDSYNITAPSFEDMVTSLDAHETSIADNTTNIGSIIVALGAGYSEGAMNFEGMGSYIATATDISQALIALDTELQANASSWGIAEYSMADTVEWLTNVTNKLGTFWIDSGWGTGGMAVWSYANPETHYLSAVEGDTLTDALVALDTAIYNAGTAGAVTLSARATAEAGYASTYDLHQGGVLKGSINIPKDFLVKSAALSTVTTADVPYTGAKVGDKYIDFVINAKDASATAEHIYLPVNDLVDVYTAQQNATQVQLAIDNNNVISATIVDSSVTTVKIADGAVTTAKIANGAVNSSKIKLIDTATTGDYVGKAYTLQVTNGRLQVAEIANS